jgi:predicted metal-binding membrane protein
MAARKRKPWAGLAVPARRAMRYATELRNLMSDAAERDFSHLPPAAGLLGAAFARPKMLAIVCVLVLAGFGWIYLALLVAKMGGALAGLGPGMGLLDLVPRTLSALCRPGFGLAMPEAAWNATGFAVVAFMWAAMVLAMMLPSAAPMILTYAEIAETAARKGERIVSPLVIAAGYAAVWLGFAALATLAQFVLTRAALIEPSMASGSALFSGALFIAAGLYQFSALKHACLTQCRQPFPFFFAHWQTTPRGVFGLGLWQGLFCLGCCWAMMAVMFAVGVMNVIWMAALGLVMTLEKIARGERFTTITGAALIAIGAGFAVAFATHWVP